MKKLIQLCCLFSIYLILTACASNQTNQILDCRGIKPESEIRIEILADLDARFPNYKAAFVSDIGLKLHAEGIRYYPVSVNTKENRTYAVIYDYSPANESCKKLSYQFIQLDPTKK